MTSEKSAYVWVWLPGSNEPVVAGRVVAESAGDAVFVYGQSYLERPSAVSLGPELPLVEGPRLPTTGGRIAGCLADAGPDGWGQQTIEYELNAGRGSLHAIDYLLLAGSDRIGALDFQASAEDYQPRDSHQGSLEDLLRVAQAVENGDELPRDLERALLNGSSIGGARPKALLHDPQRPRIAKFPSKADTRPAVNVEYAAMQLAAECGLSVANTELVTVRKQDVLLVDRFDRGPNQTRRLQVSAMTILGAHGVGSSAGRYATYHDLADEIRLQFSDTKATLRELFSRISINILLGNTDDHPRNHAAFWDGSQLALTPAYDIDPQPRASGAAAQAMAYAPGLGRSQVASLAEASNRYLLKADEAREIIETQIDVIESRWHPIADKSRIPKLEADRMLGAEILNPYALQHW